MAIGLTSTESLAEELRKLLGRSAASHDRPDRVEIIETHISWVFLTERFAYKLKKPVKFEFLDFSTVEMRRQACQAEVLLNRRLARTVYLEALPLSRDASGRLALSTSEAPIDWVVKMRRLPASKSLSRLLINDQLTALQAGSIVDYLARFYSCLPPALVRADEYCQALVRHTRSNATALSGAFPESHQATGAQLRYLALQPERFVERIVSGRIVDGHGDLRPEHIYVEDPPVVIDCIEFSDELRCVDIADELAFLDMECQRLGDGGFGKLVLKNYQLVSGDAIPAAVVSFYRGYRACVRAKVALLRSTQQTDGDSGVSVQPVKEYLELANQNAAALGAPALVMVGGLPGTGKSTLAREIAAEFGCRVLSTDRVRRHILGPSRLPAEYDQSRYELSARREIYEVLFQQAAKELSNGLSLVLDGTFNRRELQRRGFELAAECNAISLFIRCQCPREVALERIDTRARSGSSASETRPAFFDRQAREFELPDSDCQSLTVETTSSLSDQMHAVRQQLKQQLFE